METEWVLVYTTNRVWQPDIIKQVFEDNGVAVVVVNKQDSSYLFGNAEIYVRQPDIEKANELLKNIDS